MTYTTQKDVRAAFWETLTDSSLRSRFKPRRRQNDYPAEIRCAWVDFVDCLHRDGQISDRLAQRVTL